MSAYFPLATNDGVLEVFDVQGNEPARVCPNCRDKAVAFLIHRQVMVKGGFVYDVGCLLCA